MSDETAELRRETRDIQNRGRTIDWTAEMEPLLIVAAIVGVVLIAGTGAILVHKAEQRRTEQIAQIAYEMGFEFEPDAASNLVSGMGSLPVFNKGHSKKTRNVMHKVVRGSEITLLDYQYTVGSGKNRQTIKLTAAVFYCDDAAGLPNFELRPEGFWHKVGSYFGYQDIDFDSHPLFSGRYLLRGSDEAAIRAGFTPEVLDFFEKEPVKWCVEAQSNRLAIYRQGRTKPQELRQFLADATRVFLKFCPSPGSAV